MNDIERAIHRFIAESLLEDEEFELTVDTPLLEYRIIDSLSVEELLVHVHDTYGVLIEDLPPTDWDTIGKLARIIAARRVAGV
ncbi:acyl carrier protein [Kitasatospora sp. NPDC049285]|uniref:acyl carrier protein n=1 Tax=Kitasatospora sp. NPDC049285 TaxID=3157096 RepID=UPI003424CB4D